MNIDEIIEQAAARARADAERHDAEGALRMVRQAGTGVLPRRRQAGRWLVVAASLIAVAGLAVGLALIAGRDPQRPSSPVSPSTATMVLVPPPPSPLPAAPPTSSTLAAAAADGLFSPGCVESLYGRTRGPDPLPTVTTPLNPISSTDLQPLPEQPALQIALPRSDPAASTGGGSTLVRPVPGGVLIAMSKQTGSKATPTGAGSLLAVVDATGSVRWVRCFEGYLAGVPAAAVVAPVADLPDRAVIGLRAFDGSIRWQVVSLVNGVTSPLHEVLGVDEAVFRRPMLLAGRHLYVTGGEMVDIDLVAMTTVPMPPYPAGTGADGRQMVVDGQLAIVLDGPDPHIVMALYRDGRWIQDGAELDRLLSTQISNDPEGQRIVATTPSGTELWSIAGASKSSAWPLANDRVLIGGCFGGGGPGPCQEPAVIVADRTSGEVVWRRHGVEPVVEAGDAYALVIPRRVDGTLGAAEMIDVATGADAGGPQLRADAAVWAADGVVGAIGPDVVSVWYPASAELPSRTVALLPGLAEPGGPATIPTTFPAGECRTADAAQTVQNFLELAQTSGLNAASRACALAGKNPSAERPDDWLVTLLPDSATVVEEPTGVSFDPASDAVIFEVRASERSPNLTGVLIRVVRGADDTYGVDDVLAS